MFRSLIFFVSAIFFIGYVTMNQMVMGLTLLSLFAIIMSYCILRGKEYFTLVIFLIAFFTFLMGRMVLPLFYDVSDLIIDIGGEDFSPETTSKMYLCLFLSLLFVFIGSYSLAPSPQTELQHFDEKSGQVQTIRKFAKKILLLSLPFLILITLERILFVLREGYLAMYVDFRSNLPYLVNLFASLFNYAFYIFLATLPTKKEAKLPILLYLFVAVLSLGTGQRGSFVLSFLFVLMYLLLRNNLTPEEGPWIKKKNILIIAASMPLMIALLFLMAYSRKDMDSEMSANLLISFIYQQGVSVEVIGYTMDYEKYFPKGKIYLLGDIIDYFRYNIFTRVLFGTEPMEPQSVQHALEDNSLDAALTYFVKPYLYLEGGGLGGSYIAEAWKDLGNIGVCFVSYIYGILLVKIPQWFKRNVWIASVGLIMFNQIVFAPRAHAIKPISVFTSVAVLLLFAFLFWSSKTYNYRTDYKENI